MTEVRRQSDAHGLDFVWGQLVLPHEPGAQVLLAGRDQPCHADVLLRLANA